MKLLTYSDTFDNTIHGTIHVSTIFDIDTKITSKPYLKWMTYNTIELITNLHSRSLVYLFIYSVFYVIRPSKTYKQIY